MGIKLGICGTGGFAQSFIPLFKAHPLVEEVVVADLISERAHETARRFDLKRVYGSMDELCETDVDAIAIFVQRHLHGPLTIQALKAGKHVYCAVPIASTLAEIQEIVRLVETTRLTYMNGETSYYYPSALYCRDRFRRGDFGDFVYGEGAYLHDMGHFYQAFKHSGGDDWKKVAGLPPMLYCTHATGLVLSVTGARMTEVSCMGYVDRHEDGIFGEGANLWDNPFSNETALFRTSDGGMVRINEFRRIGWASKISSNPLAIYGTKGSYHETCDGQYWTGLDSSEIKDLGRLLDTARNFNPGRDAFYADHLAGNAYAAFAKVHPVNRLPKAFEGLANGHLGSHQFLVDDFVKAVKTSTLPPVHAWEAAKYCVPGIVAHGSALRGGERLPIPDFGSPPADWPLLDPYAVEA